jgi:hypothetical protein
MNTRQIYHGANGDKILSIIRTGKMNPDRQNEIFVSDISYDRARLFMHGADTRRKAAFVIKIEATIPPGLSSYRKPTPGVPNTLVLVTSVPIPVKVLELYVRKQGDGHFVEEGPILSAAAIERYLLV